MENKNASLFARSAVASAAILLLICGDAAAQPRPEAAIKIETLSPAQLRSLPGSTNVILPGGRKTSLEILRAEHTARVARFADKSRPVETLAAGSGVTQNVIPPGFKLVPMKPWPAV